MDWTNNTIYRGDPVDWSVWLFTLLSFTATASLVMVLWHTACKKLDDGGHTALIYRLLKLALIFMLVPFSTILLRLLAVAEQAPEGNTVDAFFPTPALIYVGRLLAVAWVSGILVRLGRFWQEWNSFKRFKAGCSQADEACTALFDECGRELGIKKQIPLLVSRDLSTPLLNGLFHPAVILPADMQEKGEDLRDIFLHELIHHRQKDLLYKKLAAIAGCIHWFNPLISTRMLEEVSKWSEFVCDEKVCAICSSRKQYYTILCEAAVRRSGKYLFSSALGEEKSELLVRIERMEKEKRSKKVGRRAAAALALLLLLGGTVLALGTGLGAAKVHQVILTETLGEETVLVLDPESLAWYTENKQWKDGPQTEEGKTSFSCSVLAGSVGVSPALTKDIGEKIRVAVEIEPEDAETLVGIVDADGRVTFVHAKGSVIHTFTTEKTGIYRIYVSNESGVTAHSSTIHVTGTYE